ncbi:MAG TPA: hypothetical protein VN213_03920 [Solirubrobacteraceae bacterium]|nr:hypothetical protein [Solirubrobacteraceae bacterium]
MATPGWLAASSSYRSAAHYAAGPTTGGRGPPVAIAVRGGCRAPATQCVVPGGNWYCADLNTDPFNCGGC